MSTLGFNQLHHCRAHMRRSRGLLRSLRALPAVHELTFTREDSLGIVHTNHVTGAVLLWRAPAQTTMLPGKLPFGHEWWGGFNRRFCQLLDGACALGSSAGNIQLKRTGNKAIPSFLTGQQGCKASMSLSCGSFKRIVSFFPAWTENQEINLTFSQKLNQERDKSYKFVSFSDKYLVEFTATAGPSKTSRIWPVNFHSSCQSKISNWLEQNEFAAILGCHGTWASRTSYFAVCAVSPSKIQNRRTR